MDELPNVGTMCVILESRKSSPSKCEPQVVDEWKLMSLVGKNRVSEGARHQDGVRGTAADVSLVQIIWGQVNAERLDEIRIRLLLLLFPVFKRIRHCARRVDTKRIHLIQPQTNTEVGGLFLSAVVPDPVDATDMFPEGQQ